jgi:DNA polymerase-3 subunit gamma/tau
LATTEKHKIIPTILSRCQVYDFNRIRVEDSVHYLKHIADNEGVTYDEESLNLIAQKADGGMRDALSMFDKAVSFCNANLQYRAVADTLNVLDYDTYFSMTELLLAGDYVSALLRFDEVLSKGFSGQTFMAGLNQHMRDLLLAKGPAISLIELTGTLLERYRNQAAQCPEEFLFGAIALLTEADGKIKQSSNQRLLVELGLMKIAGLGKKKNDGSPIDFTMEEFSLPDLPDKITPVATAATISVTQAQPKQPSQPTASVSANESHNQPQSIPQPTQSQPKIEPTPNREPSSNRPQSASPTRSGVSGLSIADLMRGAANIPKDDDKTSTESSEVTIDARSEEKINAVKDRVIKDILEERPRFVVAFESMQVEGHRIKVEVPTSQLYEEIMRSKTEILMQIAQTAGVTGMLVLDIKINEQIKASRPIKLEDRIKYMTERNENILELKRLLDMDYE